MTAHARPAAAPNRTASAIGIPNGEWLPGALLLLVGSIFLTGTMLAASMAPAYDNNAGAISDLGVTTETAPLFNAQLVVVGILNVAAGALLFRFHRRWWVLASFLLAGFGAVGAGLVPLDRGDLHSLFALVGFVFFNVEAVATGLVVRGPMRLISLAAGLVGLAYVGVMIVGDGGNPAIFGAIGHGGAERMIVYPAMLWTIAFGGYVVGGGQLSVRTDAASRPARMDRILPAIEQATQKGV